MFCATYKNVFPYTFLYTHSSTFPVQFFHPAIFAHKTHFPFGTGFAYSCMSGKLPGKTTKPSTKENNHDPNTPHPRRNRRRHHHRQKHPRHIKKEAIYGNRLPRLHNRIPRILLQQPLLTKGDNHAKRNRIPRTHRRIHLHHQQNPPLNIHTSKGDSHANRTRIPRARRRIHHHSQKILTQTQSSTKELNMIIAFLATIIGFLAIAHKS